MPMPHEALEENRRGVDLMAPNRPMRVGQSRDALPGVSDVDLFGYREGIIHLDAEVSDGTFDFGVAKQELYGS
jgi:hypothetical protein